MWTCVYVHTVWHEEKETNGIESNLLLLLLQRTQHIRNIDQEHKYFELDKNCSKYDRKNAEKW